MNTLDIYTTYISIQQCVITCPHHFFVGMPLILPYGGYMPNKEIGERLGKLLKTMHLKNYQFAEKFGISNASLARYKSGDRLPEPQLLLDLCKARVFLKPSGPLIPR